MNSLYGYRKRSVIAYMDWQLTMCFLLLTIIGWLSIFSAGYTPHASLFDMQQSQGRQLIWIGGSILFFAIPILYTNTIKINTFGYVIYAFTMLVLLSVFGLGTEISGSKSWIRLGAIQLQPAEFMKFSTALALAKYFGDGNRKLNNLKSYIIVGLLVAIPPLIIIAQNETGSALVFAAFAFVLYREGMPGWILACGGMAILLFVCTLIFSYIYVIAALTIIVVVVWFIYRKRKGLWKFLVGGLVVASIFSYGVSFMFTHLKDHQRTRIECLLGLKDDPHGADYNVNQSKIAIGSGRFFGKGWLHGTQTKFKFVPEQTTDFIFCTIGEEFGFLGVVALLAIYWWLIQRLLILAERQRGAFGRVYGYSVAAIFFFHVLVNIGMTIGLMPVIGIPLPFVSYGGSSYLAFTILLFIFINLDVHRKIG